MQRSKVNNFKRKFKIVNWHRFVLSIWVLLSIVHNLKSNMKFIIPIDIKQIDEILKKTDNEIKDVQDVKDTKQEQVIMTDDNKNNNNTKIKKIKKVVTLEATMYTLHPSECSKTPKDKGYGITKSGERVTPNRTVAVSRGVKFGTRYRIKEYEEFTGNKNVEFVAEDTGNKVTQGKIDIYVDDRQLAKEWGRRKVEVEVLEDE